MASGVLGSVDALPGLYVLQIHYGSYCINFAFEEGD